MINFKKIKVIIWDLDETLWKGTLSEGDVSFSNERFQLIKTITDCGIVNTICSKNDYDPVKHKLTEFGIWDLFVFPSINWDPKGIRVKTLLSDMSLRSVNALFIDDNVSNIKEVEYYNEGIMTATPTDLNDLSEYFKTAEKKDINHNRLKQYKILESKHNESLNFSSNVEFLESCDIHLSICTDSINKIDRIYELVQRTNQLNFTKVRCTLEELSNDINNPSCSSGYIRVKDRFGDYGIVGFYLLKGEYLKHFLFSCRTLGLGIEQYVYYKLGCPSFRLVPEVAIKLNSEELPHWIKEGIIDDLIEVSNNSRVSVLFKGPCDMSGLVGYLQMPDGLETDFTFTNNDGQLIENHNHSCHIYGSYKWSKEDIDILKEDAFFFTNDSINKCKIENYKIVFLSTLIEGIYGRYTHKGSGAVVAFGHYNYPLTNPLFWDNYINSTVQNYGFNISKEQLVKFSENFSFIGRTTPEDYIRFLDWLRVTMPEESVLCLILGAEIPYKKEIDESYLDRAEYHFALNSAIREFASRRKNVRLIEISQHIHSQSDFSNNINHFTPSVYYNLSRDVLAIIKEFEPSVSAKASKRRYLIKQYIQPIIRKIFPDRIYRGIKRLFLHT